MRSAEANGEPAEGEPAASALSEQVQSAFEYMPATLAGMAAGAGLVSLLFWDLAPQHVVLPWLGAFAALWFVRLAMLRRYRLASRAGISDWLGWRRIWTVATLVSGALWGLTAWLFYGYGNASQQTGLIIVIYTYCIAAVPVLSNQPRVFLVFSSLCFGPMIARIASEGDVDSLQLAGELLLIVTLTTLLARNYRQALQRVTELKLRTDGLLIQLRAEKRIADVARTQAEAARLEADIANRAKTQFFAAASHDLRQPLHAMGLFAEALRQRTREPEVAHLVNSVNESVDALEGLFSELLDITRIDSGGVEVRPEHFEMGEILRRFVCTSSRLPSRRVCVAAARWPSCGPCRSAARRAHRPQPGVERDPLHRGWLGAGELQAPRRPSARAGLGHRRRHLRGRLRARVRGVLPGAERGAADGRAAQRTRSGLAIVARLAR